MEQRIGFVATASGRVAYATAGRGPALVCDTGWVSHLVIGWEEPVYRSFFERLAATHTVVRYDKPGTGLSDRGRGVFTIEPEVAALEAVIEELGLKRYSLLGMSQGGAVAATLAARHPEAVDRLVLYGTYARGQALATPEVQASLSALVRAHWGLGSQALAELFVGSAGAGVREWFARAQRASADAETAARLLEMNYRTDVSGALRAVTAPALVLHRERDRAIPFAGGREAASLIPRARFLPLPGAAHLAYAEAAEPVLAAILEFLAPAPDAGPLTEREAEVAGLVGRGLTNVEIAGRLRLAPKTVDAHVEHIRNKLGVRSRTQIGVWASRRGLVPADV